MCKLHHKSCSGQNLSPWSPNFRNNNFLSNFMDKLGRFSTNLTPNDQNSFFSLLCPTLSSRMSRNMCKLRHKLGNAKKGVGQTFRWSNEPWWNNLTIIIFLFLEVIDGDGCTPLMDKTCGDSKPPILTSRTNRWPPRMRCNNHIS